MHFIISRFIAYCNVYFQRFLAEKWLIGFIYSQILCLNGEINYIFYYVINQNVKIATLSILHLCTLCNTIGCKFLLRWFGNLFLFYWIICKSYFAKCTGKWYKLNLLYTLYSSKRSFFKCTMFFSLSKEQDFVNYPLITRILLIKWPWKISLLTDGKKWPLCVSCQAFMSHCLLIMLSTLYT